VSTTRRRNFRSVPFRWLQMHQRRPPLWSVLPRPFFARYGFLRCGSRAFRDLRLMLTSVTSTTRVDTPLGIRRHGYRYRVCKSLLKFHSLLEVYTLLECVGVQDAWINLALRIYPHQRANGQIQISESLGRPLVRFDYISDDWQRPARGPIAAICSSA